MGLLERCAEVSNFVTMVQPRPDSTTVNPSRRFEMKNVRVILWAFIAALSFSASVAASDAVIRGVVTDNDGKPVRGALVKAQSGYKIVTRFSQKDGRYEIT